MKKIRLIIVDDDSDTGRFMSTKLSNESPGFEISLLKDAGDCLSYLERNEADCILCDYQMPGMDGIALLQAVRGRGLDVPFIFITGQGNEELAREAFKNGAYDYFTKEVGFAHFSRIANSIEQAIRAAELERMRHRAEIALLEEKSRFQELAGSMADAFFMVTPDNSRLHYISPAFEQIWGMPAEEVYRNPLAWMDSVHEEDRERVAAEVRREVGMTGPREMEFRIIRPDGETRWIRSRTYPVFEDGVLSRVGGTAEDITLLKDLEKQRSDMYAMIRHDVKSPLMVIRGNAESLARTCGHGSSSGPLDAIINNVDRISGLLDGLVTISRLGEGRLSLREEPVDPGVLALEAVVDYKEASGDKGLKLSWDVEKGLPKLVMDRNYAMRALSNLVGNALNYTPSGGRVKVSVGSESRGGTAYVRFAVSDTGPGVHPDEREKIFEKYYRSESTSQVRGSGLGLAIVKAVAEAHDGFVELESEPGNGSEFSMLIPVNRP